MDLVNNKGNIHLLREILGGRGPQEPKAKSNFLCFPLTLAIQIFGLQGVGVVKMDIFRHM